MNIQRQKWGKEILLNVLRYYSIFEYPLSLYELYIYQFDRVDSVRTQKSLSLGEIEFLLQQEDVKKDILFGNGFYYLNGDDFFVQQRLGRYRLAIEKFDLALKHFFWLRFLPGVKMIGVCNSLPLQNTSDQGDIDMFIVADSQRIWTVRFFVIIYLKLFCLRPTEKKHKNKLCPSFFVTEDSLDLEEYQNGDDIYFRHWVSQVVACYDSNNFFQDYWHANSWVKKYLPAVEPHKLPDHLQIRDSKIIRAIKYILCKISYLVPEKYYRNIQLSQLPKSILYKANKAGASVVLNDQILKFHTKDRRAQINQKFKDMH